MHLQTVLALVQDTGAACQIGAVLQGCLLLTSALSTSLVLRKPAYSPLVVFMTGALRIRASANAWQHEQLIRISDQLGHRSQFDGQTFSASATVLRVVREISCAGRTIPAGKFAADSTSSAKVPKLVVWSKSLTASNIIPAV